MFMYIPGEGDAETTPTVNITLAHIPEEEKEKLSKVKSLMAVQFAMDNCDARLRELATEYDANSFAFVINQILTMDPEMYQDIVIFIQNLITRRMNKSSVELLAYLKAQEPKVEIVDEDTTEESSHKEYSTKVKRSKETN